MNQQIAIVTIAFITVGGNIMLTLSELSKQAEELYNKFVDDYNQTELEDLIPYTDDYDLEYLDEITTKSGHCDEQILDAYLSATDEDGNYIHPYNNEIN